MRKYFITGLLVLVPLAITVWVLSMVISTMDRTLQVLPQRWQPVALFGYDLPGAGTLLTLIIIFAVGVLAHNFVGKQVVHVWELILKRIPIVSPIYSSVKQVSDTVFSPNGNAFRKAVLIQYPREGTWTIAFVTGTPGGEVGRNLGAEYVGVYVPTTPNPTSGYFLMVPRAEAIELDMSVDAALKYVVSMGVIAPELTAPRNQKVPPSRI